MLITVCYVYMWVHFNKCYSRLVYNAVCRLKGRSLLFCSCSMRELPAAPTGHGQTDNSLPTDIFLQLGDKAVFITEPQACDDDMSKWTVFFRPSLVCGPSIENISFIVEASGQRVGNTSIHSTNNKVLKWSDYCLPLAYRPCHPFRAVAQTSAENFSRIGVAFIEDRLQLDEGLVPSKIVSVILHESTLTELLEKQHSQTVTTITLPFTSSNGTQDIPHVSEPLLCQKDSICLISDANKKLAERRGSEPPHNSHSVQPVGDEDKHSLEINHHMEGHGHHLHLSSCHECLQLESSTILSVKYASAENIPDLPMDKLVGLDSGEESFEESDHDMENGGIDCNCKSPNILVYTSGCQERFEKVCLLLKACINMEHNIIYLLLPQQALSDPWLDNTRLLVLAEEQSLSPQLQARILTYLNQGGKVLGLASSLCLAGLSLEVLKEQHMMVSNLSFTGKDNTKLELSMMASGKVYVMEMEGAGDVEVWGEFKGDNPQTSNVVIVRVTQGEDSGEAVLCQVLFDLPADSQAFQGFDQLKDSNPLPFEVLTNILTSLGLNCELNQNPTPSPVHLLATGPEAKSRFLSWLEERVDQNGVLALSKTSLKMLSHEELQGASTIPANNVLPLLTESKSFKQFCMQTYIRNLKTNLLGHTLLFAEVVTSTMDLLEGLTLRLPKDMSVMAVALRQNQGRGRGRNSWLSPVGCAMFTLGVQVEISSRLGQRIPFLQHLAALAVVEAVRTLPGYEDIDLRVKWPNDIYYKNVMKIGGVLVTSTVMGSTFYTLIGCGFNVTNSSPTVCINDLIQLYNKQQNCSLAPLSCAQLIARTVTCLEALISSFQRRGPELILPLYYKSGTQVRLWCEDGLEVQVVGLDHNGFLQVYSKEKGVVSVEPDGNSFDMLKNLVVIKQK
ncbi:biotin--protein ligase isoform X2 [Gouania willdenowi]|uniref:biotin--protein ligase isoform X2 n=1 Tax=Gouania willdenowi TaxID=441366 RepID=UPI001056BE46|nr:biotin--protein ligase isoform X2 [Gouania willdenowi]